MPSRVLDHWGLVRPYRFDRLLCLVSAGGLAVLVILYAIYCALTGELIRHTPREDYFVYLLALVLAGAALAPWPRLAVLPLAL